MAITLNEEQGGRLLVVSVTGKLTKEDYQVFSPTVERLIKDCGKIRILFQMHDFHGWSMGAMWEDVKFSLHHFRDIERLAMVGEKKWQVGMGTFCKPFTKAEVKYFTHDQLADARAWVEQPVAAPA